MGEPIVVGGGGRGGNRRVLVLAGVAAAMILGVVVLPGLLFSDGGSPPTDDALPPVTGGGPSVTTPTETPPAETFEPFTSTNPFTPLVETAAAPVDDPGLPPDIDPTTDTTFPDDFAFPDDPGSDPGFDGTLPPDDESTTTTTAPPRPQNRVSLLEVFADQNQRVVASVRVNDTTYQVGEGEDFASSYRVLDLDIRERCGQLLYGDDRFELCEGDEVLV